MATGTSRSTRYGVFGAVLIAVVLMGYAIASSNTSMQLWEFVVPVGVIGGIVLGGMMVGGALENSRVESAALRSILVALAGLATGYLVFAIIGTFVFAIVTSG